EHQPVDQERVLQPSESSRHGTISRAGLIGQKIESILAQRLRRLSYVSRGEPGPRRCIFPARVPSPELARQPPLASRRPPRYPFLLSLPPASPSLPATRAAHPEAWLMHDAIPGRGSA